MASFSRPQDPTAAVRSTDEDAAVSRLSCAELGYINDPFARLFVKRPCPRPPLINVGTHARTWAMDKLVRDFMKSNPSRPKQVLSLGAGTDTRFFKLGRLDAGDWKPTRYVEIDYPESTSKKASILKRNPAFAEALGQDVRLAQGGTAFRSAVYNLLPGDLAQLPNELGQSLIEGAEALLDPSQDTLILAECVFIYVDPVVSSNIIRWCSKTFPSSLIVLYDPIGFRDPFGQMMISNLRRRQIELPGITINESTASIKRRLEESGYSRAQVEDMASIRKSRIPREEKERISKLELVDEYEELDLVLSHYAVAWAANTTDLETIGLS